MMGHGVEDEKEDENDQDDDDDVEVLSHTQTTPAQSSKKSSATKHKTQSRRKSSLLPTTPAAASTSTLYRSVSPSPSSHRPRRQAVVQSKLVAQLASEAAVSVDELRALFNDDGGVHAAELRKQKRTRTSIKPMTPAKATTDESQHEHEEEDEAVVTITGTDVTPATSSSSTDITTAAAKPTDTAPILTEPPKKSAKQLSRMSKLQRMLYRQQVEAWEEYQRQPQSDGIIDDDQDEIGVAFIVSMKRNPDYGKRNKFGHSATLYQVRWDDGSETWEPESILDDVPEVRRDWKRRSAIAAWRQAHPGEYEIGGEEEEAAREEFEFISSIPGGIAHFYESESGVDDEEEIDATVVNVLTNQVTQADRERIAAEHEARDRIRTAQTQAEKREAKRKKREEARASELAAQVAAGGTIESVTQSSNDIRTTIQEALQQRKARRSSTQSKLTKPKKYGVSANIFGTPTPAAAAVLSSIPANVLVVSQPISSVPIIGVQPPPLIPVASEPFIPYEDDLFEDEFYDDDALYNEEEPEWTHPSQKRRRTSGNGAPSSSSASASASKPRHGRSKKQLQSMSDTLPLPTNVVPATDPPLTPGLQALQKLTPKWRWRLSTALVGLSPFPTVPHPPDANPLRWRTHQLLRAVLLEWTDVEMHRQVLKVNPWTYKSNAPQTIDEAQQIALQSMLQTSLTQVTDGTTLTTLIPTQSREAVAAAAAAAAATQVTQEQTITDNTITEATNTTSGDTNMTPTETITSVPVTTDTPVVPSEPIEPTVPIPNDTTTVTIETSESNSVATSAATIMETTIVMNTTTIESSTITIPAPTTTVDEVSTTSSATSVVSQEQSPILPSMVVPMDIDHDNQSAPIQTTMSSSSSISSPSISNPMFAQSSSSAFVSVSSHSNTAASVDPPTVNPISISPVQPHSSSANTPRSSPMLTPEQLMNAAVERQLQMKAAMRQ